MSTRVCTWEQQETMQRICRAHSACMKKKQAAISPSRTWRCDHNAVQTGWGMSVDQREKGVVVVPLLRCHKCLAGHPSHLACNMSQ